MKTKLAAGFAVCTLLVASACGGGRPSVDEISEALQDGNNELSEGMPGIDEETADCLAELFHDSDISDEGLQALIDGDEDYEDADDEAAVEEIDQDEFFECVMGDTDMPDLETPEAP